MLNLCCFIYVSFFVWQPEQSFTEGEYAVISEIQRDVAVKVNDQEGIVTLLKLHPCNGKGEGFCQFVMRVCETVVF
jgi:hypothetical protein